MGWLRRRLPLLRSSWCVQLGSALARILCPRLWRVRLTCSASRIQGLCLTLMFLGVFQKALPALPISIALGAMFVASTHFVVTPFAVSLGTEHMAMI